MKQLNNFNGNFLGGASSCAGPEGNECDSDTNWGHWA